ncbi:hypothetical protein BC937DRAFT_88779 [Endogone sp. FLAS-F59071]|nr:hypothetical protein BC937DRAFT_88779 [Endogone sp. FLAS-F59071]|eukprot:RUS18428.1 hypothetical protein BC937DRAFT_88779 [Endogone sp. FLAS-F59071]
MHGRRLDGYTLNIQWAKNAPSSSWRYDRRSRSPGGSGRSSRHRSSLSPRRPSRRHSPSPSPRISRSRSRSHTPRGRSHSPPRPEGDARRGSQNVDRAEASVEEDRPMPLAEGATEGDARSPNGNHSRSTSPKRDD